MPDIAQKKTCFVITPIGDENTEIRRHIDGIIEAAIIPVLENEFDVKAAHHINEPGNITKQIIRMIYESDLVVANLTGRNANVMYELALRHCVGKPTIMISDKDTTLPSDIISERTNFYINDSKGVLELRDKLCKCIAEIDFSSTERKSPIYDALKEIEIDNILVDKVAMESPQEASVLSLILNKLDNLEDKIKVKDANKQSSRYESAQINIRFKELNEEELNMISNDLDEEIRRSFMHSLVDEPTILVTPAAISITLNFDKGTAIQPRVMNFIKNVDKLFKDKNIELKEIYNKRYNTVMS